MHDSPWLESKSTKDGEKDLMQNKQQQQQQRNLYNEAIDVDECL